MTIVDALKDLYPNCAWTLENFDYDTLKWSDETPKPTLEELTIRSDQLVVVRKWEELREERNKRIAQTDYLFTSDYPHATEEVKQAWLDYRQSLRDLPANTEDPSDPTWPQEPTD
jgi:hypothetical protein